MYKDVHHDVTYNTEKLESNEIFNSREISKLYSCMVDQFAYCCILLIFFKVKLFFKTNYF